MGKAGLAGETDIFNADVRLQALLSALTYAIKQRFFLLLICCLLRYLYTIKQNDKISSLKESEKTTNLTICKPSLERIFCLKTNWPDGLLLKYDEVNLGKAWPLLLLCRTQGK